MKGMIDLDNSLYGDVLKFYQTKEYHIPVQHGWDFKEPERYGIIARLAWKLLKRMGAIKEHMDVEIQVKQISRSKIQSVVDDMMDMFNEIVWNHGGHVEDFVFIIGMDDFFDLTKDAANPVLHHTAKIHYGNGPYKTIYGVDVYVVPHYTGRIVLPKYMIEKELK